MLEAWKGLLEPGGEAASLAAEIDPARLPAHVAVIMDGNGRWAQERGRPRLDDHRAAIKSVKEIVETAARTGIRVLSLYAFSKENWRRPRREVSTLFRVLEDYLVKEDNILVENDLRLKVLGQREGLPPSLLRELDRVEARTASNRRMTVGLALNYGARAEIVDAVRDILRQGRLKPEDVDEAEFARHLYTAGLPDPDLLIRTSGEMRISNFLLWQIAYAEIWTTPVYWPDFRKVHFFQALRDYQSRDRRYGALPIRPMSDRQRYPTALILLAALFAVIQWGPAWAFFAFIQIVILAAVWELDNLARRRRLRPQRAIGLAAAMLVSASFLFPRFPLALALLLGLLAAAVYYVAAVDTVEKLAVFPSSIALTLFGAVYLALPVNYLYWILLQDGRRGLFFLLAVIFVGDSGAYWIGSALGRHRMTPIASPNKTWEGAAGGLLFALGGAIAARFLFLPSVGLPAAAVCGVLVHAAAQLADPLESLFKRAAGVKDSSNLLPGHGGFLDRVDSFVLAAPLYYYLVRLLWK